ncbi:MAG: hypothetical protein ACOC04_01510, partial [Halothece sp.]
MINPKPVSKNQTSLYNALSGFSEKTEKQIPLFSRIGLKAWFSRLRVGQKISLGYGLALGIAVVGTTTGIIIGDYYQRKAWVQEEHAQKEIALLHRLQTHVLQIRTHQQQLIPLSEIPALFTEEYAHILSHSEELKKTWSE